MDAKKEAEELVDAFKRSKPLIGSYMLMNTDQAIQCALISIKSTIKALWEVEHSFCAEKIKELEEVKQEINKL